MADEKNTKERSYDNKAKVAFIHAIQPSPNCIEWPYGKNSNGYGQMRWDGSSKRLAHRVSYEFHRGPIPPKLFVLHRCDNPACINPDHLFIGNYQDNIDDARSKGRLRPFGKPMPEPRPWRDALICKEYLAGATIRQLVKKYKISPNLICSITTEVR